MSESPYFAERLLDVQDASSSRSVPRCLHEKEMVEQDFAANDISREEHDRLLAVLDGVLCGCCG